MSGEPINREEYNTGISRIHDKIESIKEMSIRVEENTRATEKVAEKIKDKVDELCKVMYGNGKEGLISRLNKLGTKLNYHWFLLGIILVAIFSFATRITCEYLKSWGGSYNAVENYRRRQTQKRFNSYSEEEVDRDS